MQILFVYSNGLTELLPAPPIGLSYVATATARAGHDIEFLDLLIGGDPTAQLRDALTRFQPEVVGVSVRNLDNLVHQQLHTHLGCLEAQIDTIRQHSNARIVLGGPAISILGARALERLDADFAVVGEGERAFPMLLDTLEYGGDPGDIAGVCIRAGGRVTTRPAAALEGFGDSGMQHWVHWRAYQRRGATWPIQSKRGCPLACSYCSYSTIEGLKLRKRPPREVVDEIEYVQTVIRPRTFEFIDSTFNLPESHALAVCEEIVRRGLKVRLTAMGVNPLGVSRELFELMKRAGFNSMMITPEHVTDQVLDNLNKGFGTHDVYRTASLARQSGIASMWFFMLGGPGETRTTVEQTMQFIEKHLRWRGCLSMITTGIRVLPGTQLARRAVDEGQLGADSDMADPVFYFSGEVSEAWILRRINRTIAGQPNVVHAAEDGHPRSRAITDRLHRVYDWLGVAPPYWRLLPGLLRVKPIHRLRMRPYNGRRRER